MDITSADILIIREIIQAWIDAGNVDTSALTHEQRAALEKLRVSKHWPGKGLSWSFLD